MTRFKLSLYCGALLALAAPAYGADVTANVTLTRGHIIEQGDIKLSPEGSPHSSAIMNRYIGQQMRRTVYAGARLSANHVDRPVLVRRNKRVNMIYRLGRLEMTASGRAMDEGGAGDIITVMNLESKLRVQGEVLADGSIEVIR